MKNMYAILFGISICYICDFGADVLQGTANFSEYFPSAKNRAKFQTNKLKKVVLNKIKLYKTKIKQTKLLPSITSVTSIKYEQQMHSITV